MTRRLSLSLLSRCVSKHDNFVRKATRKVAQGKGEEVLQIQCVEKVDGAFISETSSTEQLHIASQQEIDLTTDGIVYPKGVRFYLITVSLCLCVFLVGLDATIVATAIPRITDEFHSIEDVGWYGAAFRLSSSMVQLSQGKIFDSYSTKWAFFVNMIIFEAGLAVAGAATNSPVFIVGRAIAGIGSSGINQGCMVIMATSTPLAKRATYVGFICASEHFAIAIAPLLGGALTSSLSWRWCFYINIPCAVPPVILLLLLDLPSLSSTIRTRSNLQKLKELDLLGCLFLAPAVFCLLLALQWGGTTYTWYDTRIIVLLVLGPVLLTVFFYTQYRKQDAAMLPPRIIRKPSIILGSLYSLSLSAVVAIVQYYLTIWFQAVLGVPPLQSGIKMLPLVVAILVSVIVTGYFITWSGSYMSVMIPSSLLVVASVAVLAALTPTSPAVRWITPLVLLGIGCGGGISSPFLAVQNVLSLDDISKGMALMTFAQDIGQAVFVSIAQVVFLNRVQNMLSQEVPELSPETIFAFGATAFREKVPAPSITDVVNSYNSGVTSTFYLATGLAAILVISACVMQVHFTRSKRKEQKS